MLCLWCLSTALIFCRRKFWLSQTQLPTACLWRWHCSVGSCTPEIICVCVTSIQSPAQILKVWRIFTNTGKMSLTVTTDRSTLGFISKLLQLLCMRLCKPFHCTRFEVLQTAGINIKVVWNVKLCIQVNRYRHFRKTCCLHPCKWNVSTLHDITAHKHRDLNDHITKTIQDLKQFCEPSTATADFCTWECRVCCYSKYGCQLGLTKYRMPFRDTHHT
jgi:hypothetical protein